MKELLRKIINLGVPEGASRKQARSHGAVNLSLTTAIPTNFSLALLYYWTGFYQVGHYFLANALFLGLAGALGAMSYRKTAVYVGLITNLLFISLVGVTISADIGVGIVLLALGVTMFTVFNFEEKLHLAISCGMIALTVFCYLHFENGIHGAAILPSWLLLTQRIVSLGIIFGIMGASLLFYEKLTEEIYSDQNQVIADHARDLKAALLRSESLNSISTIFSGAFLDREPLHECCDLLQKKHHYFEAAVVLKEAFDKDFEIKAYSSTLQNLKEEKAFEFKQQFSPEEFKAFLKVYKENETELYPKTVQSSFGASETAICILNPIKHFGVLYICMPNEMKHSIGQEREFIDSVTKNLAMYFEKNVAIEEKMETYKSANRLKDDFLAKTSHELRTPLNGIIGLTEMLINRHRDIGADSLRSIRIVKRSGERLLLLVNDLLDYARMRRKTITLNKTSFNIVEVVEGVFSILRKEAVQNKVRLNHDIADDAIMVYADKDRLNQVLTNLVHNAIQHTEKEKGTVGVEVHLDNQDIVLQVSDNGHGMAPESIKVAFEPFVSAKSSKDEAHHGVGIGLNITKELVELHDGKIEIRSALEKGTTISITLPEAKSYEPVIWAAEEGKTGGQFDSLADSQAIKKTLDLVVTPKVKKVLKKLLVIDDK